MLTFIYRTLMFVLSFIRAMLIPAALILVAVAPDWMPVCLEEVRSIFIEKFDRSTTGKIRKEL